jgi:hypothetical protein
MWAGVAIVCGVVMGGNGMSPDDAIALASSSTRALLVLGAAWLHLSCAAVRDASAEPGRANLRALPGGPAYERVAIALAAAAVHVPWAVLWFLGGGAARGTVAWLAMTVASLLLVVGAGRFARAPRTPRWSTALGAIAGVHARSLTRRRMSALVTGAGLAALGGAFAALVIGHEAESARDAVVISGAVASIALAASLVAAATAVSESDRQLGWLSSASAVAPATRRAGVALVLGALGIAASLAATLASAAVASLSPAMFAAVIATNAAIGLGTGLASVEVGARARKIDVPSGGRATDGSRVVVGLLLVGVIGLVSIGVFRELGVLVVLAIGAGAAAGGRSRA